MHCRHWHWRKEMLIQWAINRGMVFAARLLCNFTSAYEKNIILCVDSGHFAKCL